MHLKREIRIARISGSMTSESELMEKVKTIIEKNGREALEKTRQEILSAEYDGGEISAALKYFAKTTLRGGLPVFPALLSLSCEAVGGKKEQAVPIGAALMLIAGAADVHDDVIDQSAKKGYKTTVYGKFGRDITILAGDALLLQGIMLLHRECESLLKRQRDTVLNLVSQAVFEIGHAEALETKLRKKLDLTPEEYLDLLKMKAVVPELHTRTGAILGNANEEQVEALGNYGRVFGIVSGIREEFIDLLEYPELQSRLSNECPPLPLLYALQDPEQKKAVAEILEAPQLTKAKARKLANTVLKTGGVMQLKNEMEHMIWSVDEQMPLVQDLKVKTQLSLLLKSVTDGL
jgi:geranylgeranyl pyrophosphate synthase